MLDQFGKRKYILPIGIIIAVACVFSLMFYPMAHLELKDLPMAVVCLDEGVETSEGDVNLGSLVVDKIMDTAENSNEESPIVWTKLTSEDELENAMAENKFFGALVIPKDFSRAQYDVLLDSMQERVDDIQDTIKNDSSLGSDTSLPNLADAASLSTPVLSGDVQKMIDATKGLAAGAAKQAESAAVAFKQKQAAVAEAQKLFTAAEKESTSLQESIDTMKTKKASLQKQYDAASIDKKPAIKKQLDDLEAEMKQAEASLATGKAELEKLKTALEQAKNELNTAQTNLATAQANAKTAAINAAGSEKTALAGATLAARAQAFSSIISQLKDKLSNLDISSRFDDMGEIIAAKALVTAADKLQDGEGTSSNTESPMIYVYLDVAKSPMVANTLKTTMAALFGQSSFSSEVMMIHDGTPEGETMTTALQAAQGEDENSQSASAASPLSSMMSLQITIIPVMILSLVIGLILTRLFKFGEATTRKEKISCWVKQLVYGSVVSCLIALVAYGMFAWVADGSADFGSMFLYMWMVSFCMLIAASGLGNVALGLGVLVVVCTIAFGNMTGAMPAEGLPAFWADWIYPWAPQHFFGEGIRSIMYLGSGAWTAASPLFLCIGLAGLAFSALAVLIPHCR